jgi:hypothetical protein
MQPRASSPDNLRLAFRIAWYGGAAVAVIAYAVLVPLRWYNLLPMRMTWSRLVLGPALLTLMLPVMMTILSQTGRKRWLWFCIWLMSLFALSAIVSFFDPVPAGSSDNF